MLTSLRLENFKSFKDERIELGPTTLLLGANASGKSNFLDALRFLQGVALGFSIKEVLGGKTAGGREIWPGIRGGAREIGFRGVREFRITSEWEIEGESFSFAIECKSGLVSRERDGILSVVLKEELARTTSAGETELLLEGKAEVEERALYYRYRVGGDPRRVHAPPTTASIGRETWPHAEADGRQREMIGAVQSELRELSFLEAQPTRMRDYTARAQTELGSSGEHLSSVLAAMTADPEQRTALVDWLTELCGPEVADVDFSRTDLDDVMLVLVDAAGARTSARSLSDGTLRFLALLVALRDTARNKILLLEEIESGLHPARLHLLVEQLEARAQAPGAQVIATTHSPTLLAALPDPTLRDAVVFASTPGHEGTLMRRLGDLPDFDEVVKRRGIEHLFTTRWLERAL